MYQSPIVIERALTENGEIQLQKRGSDYEIIFNGTFLMATYNGDSEKLLVRWAIETADSPKTVLIAGLGVGFSLAEAQNHKMIEKITVVEIEQKIIEWNRTYLSASSEGALTQQNVDVVNTDFIQWMKKPQKKYDVICLKLSLILIISLYTSCAGNPFASNSSIYPLITGCTWSMNTFLSSSVRLYISMFSLFIFSKPETFCLTYNSAAFRLSFLSLMMPSIIA